MQQPKVPKKPIDLLDPRLVARIWKKNNYSTAAVYEALREAAILNPRTGKPYSLSSIVRVLKKTKLYQTQAGRGGVDTSMRDETTAKLKKLA